MQGLAVTLLSQDFIPHGHCYLWKPELVWLHVISDSLIALAYYSIPLLLIHLVRHREDLPFHWMFSLFSAFIVACGTTHVLEVWTLWYPTYWLSGLVKLVTAGVSLYTAMMLVPLVPKVLAIPSAAQLEAANHELEREISDRKQIEAALRKSEALLTEAQHIAKMGNWEFDLETQKLTWSQELFRILNWDIALPAPTYADFRALHHPSDIDKLDQAVQQTIATGQPYALVLRVPLANGAIRFVEATGYAERTADGKAVRLYGTTQDVSDRIALEQALAEKQQLLDTFITSAPIGMAVLNNQLQFTLINQALADINGLPAIAHIGKTPWEVVPDLAPKQAEIFLNVLNTGQPILDAEIVGETPKLPGVSRAWLSSYFPVHNDGQPPSGIGIVVMEISDRRQAEEKIKASLKEKEVLLKEIHHRVKNNLQIVDGLLQMQSRRSTEPQVTMVLQDSQSRIASIALVHEKLYCSETLSDIDFAYYIPDLTAHLFESYKISPNQIQLQLQVDQVTLDIETAIPCGLIVNELVSNALKYAFPDNREGTVQIEFHENEEGMMVLSVRDNGVGLPPNFDLQSTRSLGLTLLQGLVEQLDGTLEINGHQGAQFKVIFPKGL